MPTLKPFQREGVEYILDARRVLVADEMGLGKTAQALMAIGRDEAFPAVVVCPASLKINWQREVEKWLPGASTQILNGMKPVPLTTHFDVTIVNYDILGPWRPHLGGMAAVVFDECHFLKNAKTKRTWAGIRLARSAKPGALILGLTGTPILNAPHELISQLDFLGMLDQFGGPMAFCDRYCPIWKMKIKLKNGRKHEIEKHGAKHIEELKRKLRKICMIRRLKSEVLPELPAKQRQKIWFGGSGSEMKAYREIGKQNISSGVKLIKLRQQLGLAKVRDCLDWLENQPEPVVVFVHHKAVAEAMLKELKCPTIRGGMTSKARQEAVDTFQGGKATRIVCSIQAAAFGFTLTAASNLLFVEQAFTPAVLEQAEDRCHRIGQTNAVMVWYACIPETIDELIFRKLRDKAGIIEGVTGSIENDLILELEKAA